MKYLQKIASDNRKQELNALLFEGDTITVCDSFKYIRTKSPFDIEKDCLISHSTTNIIDDIELEDDDGAWTYRNGAQTPALQVDKDGYPDLDVVTPKGEPDATIKLTIEQVRELFEALDRDCEDEYVDVEIHNDTADTRNGGSIVLHGDEGTEAMLMQAK